MQGEWWQECQVQGRTPLSIFLHPLLREKPKFLLIPLLLWVFTILWREKGKSCFLNVWFPYSCLNLSACRHSIVVRNGMAMTSHSLNSMTSHSLNSSMIMLNLGNAGLWLYHDTWKNDLVGVLSFLILCWFLYYCNPKGCVGAIQLSHSAW